MNTLRPVWHDPGITSVAPGDSPVIAGSAARDAREASGLLLRLSGTTLCLLFTGLPIVTSLPDSSRKPPEAMPVNCTQVEELALRHVSGTTDTLPSRRVVRHLTQCPRCQAYWRQLRTMRRPQLHVGREPGLPGGERLVSCTSGDHDVAIPAKLSL
jgi:hypothetical protein